MLLDLSAVKKTAHVTANEKYPGKTTQHSLTLLTQYYVEKQTKLTLEIIFSVAKLLLLRFLYTHAQLLNHKHFHV